MHRQRAQEVIKISGKISRYFYINYIDITKTLNVIFGRQKRGQTRAVPAVHIQGLHAF